MSTVLPQAIAPALGTSMFAASIESPLLGGNMIWAILLVFCGFLFRDLLSFGSLFCATATIVAVHSFTLSEPDTDWREQKEKDESEYATIGNEIYITINDTTT